VIFFIVLQLPVIILISYLLNRKKIYSRVGNIYITSFFEGLGSYLIILSVFLGDFVANMIIQIVLLVIGFTIIAFTKNYINEAEPEIDLQLETLKNLVVIFSSTLLLFYVMLSVFRFQQYFLQFFYALLVVIIFNIIAIFLKKWFSKIWDKLYFDNSMFVSFSSIYLYISIAIIVLLVIFINFPKVAVNKAINLNNSHTYFVYQNGQNDLVNRFDNNLLVDIDTDMDSDNNAFINQDDEHVFIYLNNKLIVFDLTQQSVVYSGVYQENIDGLVIPSSNNEINEDKYQTDCSDETNCSEFTYPYQYGDVKFNAYRSFDIIIRVDNLDYNYSDTVFFSNNILYLFEGEELDSRLSTAKDKPLLGFADSKARVLDVDNYDGSIFYLEIERGDEQLNIKVYEVIEKDVDVVLPFYSHYRFGILIFILLLGFVPITNFDLYKSEVR